MRRAREPLTGVTLRSALPGDEAALAALGVEAFGRYSTHPAESVRAMLRDALAHTAPRDATPRDARVARCEVRVAELAPKATGTSGGPASQGPASQGPGGSAARGARGPLVVGFVALTHRIAKGPFGPWAEPVVSHLDAIAVRRDLRGRGLGKQLLAEAERLARARGSLSVSLTTAVSNVRARTAFRAAGYVAWLPLPEHYFGGEARALDAVAMSKVL
jgi:ribosomal protein S18 acetylase RimI-like enzyme